MFDLGMRLKTEKIEFPHKFFCCWRLNTWNERFFFFSPSCRAVVYDVFDAILTCFFFVHFQEKKPESAKKSKKDENGAEDDEEVDDENEEAEDEEYELNYGEEIDGEGKTIT
jgi:hypothetical protein